MSCRDIEDPGRVISSHPAGHLVAALGRVAVELSEVAAVDPVILDIVRSHSIVSQDYTHRLSGVRGHHSLRGGPQHWAETLHDLTVEHQFVRIWAK